MLFHPPMRPGALLVAFLLACGGPSESDVRAAAVPRAADLAIEFAGCLVVERGTRCELSADHKLSFWLPGQLALQTLRADGRALALPPRKEIEGGGSYELQVTAGVKKLELGAPGAALTLELLEPNFEPGLETARRLREQGQFTQARQQLTAALNSRQPDTRRRAQALSARLSLAEGDHQVAAAALALSMELAATVGAYSEAIRDATALSFVASSNLRDYRLARHVLQQAAVWAALDPAGAALLPHYDGVLALETGDLQRALLGFRESARRTRRLGLREHELLAREQEAWTLVLLGRNSEAVAAQRRVVDEFPSSDACQRADRTESVVWFALMAEPARDSPLTQLIGDYGARAELELESCPSPWRARNHRINAALAALQRDDAQLAAAELKRLSKLPKVSDPLLETWEHELRGRAALYSRKPRWALPQFQAALELSQRVGLWDNLQLAQLGRARALVALRQRPAALEAYAGAERSLDASLANVPFSEGQAGFRHAREAGTQEWIDLLLRTGATAQAFEVARSAGARRLARLAATQRARNLSSAARQRWEAALALYHERRRAAEHLAAAAWEQPADRLPYFRTQLAQRQQAAREALDDAYAALRSGPELVTLSAAEPGEALLGLFTDGASLRVFVQTPERTQSYSLPVPRPGPELGQQLLGPAAALLARSSRLRVIAHASLGWLDVHAQQLGGVRLLQRFSVRYASDIAVSAPLEPPAEAALIVSDPRGDLPAAALETALVSRSLPLKSETLQGPAARRGDILDRLGHVAFFHYAGHHRVAGIEGTDSALLVADGELSVGDVLTLGSAPQRIVLSTCEAARQGGQGWSGVLGMGQAFIAAGAEEVIAASRPVPDQTARDLGVAFYAVLKADPHTTLTEALRRAQLSLWASRPTEDWAAFRALSR